MEKINKTHLQNDDHERIKACISNVLDHYFKDMENHFDGDLYNLVLREVESPLFQKVLEYTQFNQSQAAQILGVSRGTLRKKIAQYQLKLEKNKLEK